MAAAKHRAIDVLRRTTMLDRKHEELGREIESRRELAGPDLDAAIDDEVGDDLLRLMLAACHPVLSSEARVALTLRLLGGLTTEEIARAFLVSEPTVAQRIVRAKRTLREARVPRRRGDHAGARRSLHHRCRRGAGGTPFTASSRPRGLRPARAPGGCR
jgi:RNA polymerase sigma factor (sigma-70 family)